METRRDDAAATGRDGAAAARTRRARGHRRYEEVEIGEQIGGGGVALVYAGYFNRRPVALKTLFDVKVTDALKKEYMDELLVMADLRHPHVVEFVGACLDPPNYFFVMERCDLSLCHLLHGSTKLDLRPERLDVQTKLRYCGEIADAMAYLYRADNSADGVATAPRPRRG